MSICGAATCSSRPSSEKGATQPARVSARGAWNRFLDEKPEAGGREVDRPVEPRDHPAVRARPAPCSRWRR
jgi:hypothetical protein